MPEAPSALPLPSPRHAPSLDPDFKPAALANRSFLRAVASSGKSVPLALGLERGTDSSSVFRTLVFHPSHPDAGQNLGYAERLLKALIWQRGARRVLVGGPSAIHQHLARAYAPDGSRAFDAEFMSGVYETPFTVDHCELDKVPPARENSAPKGGHLDGCRIGFDAGASDRKVAAVVDGKSVYSEEVIWNPKQEKDPAYHYEHIAAAFKSAAEHMPRVDAIGVSAAGIYIANRVMVASLFRGIPRQLFMERITNMFLQLKREWGNVPLEVCNDGDVTALAGSMNLNDGAVLGIAMGSSEAGGYVTPEKCLTDWLNELAFVPVDYNPSAAVDEWSGDYGCGSQYFSQVGAIRLATGAGLDLSAGKTPAEKLKVLQAQLDKGDDRAARVFESIGCYLGYALAHYADLYRIRHVLILGRVTSGKGGNLLMNKTREVLRDEFPELATSLNIVLPEEETERRVGQAIAAASLPVIENPGRCP